MCPGEASVILKCSKQWVSIDHRAFCSIETACIGILDVVTSIVDFLHIGAVSIKLRVAIRYNAVADVKDGFINDSAVVIRCAVMGYVAVNDFHRTVGKYSTASSRGTIFGQADA